MHTKHKRQGGQFQGAFSTYDKRDIIQKQRALKAKKVNKYRKTLKKLEAEGRLAPRTALIPSTELPEDIRPGTSNSSPDSEHEQGQQRGQHQKRQQQQQQQHSKRQRLHQHDDPGLLPPPPTTDKGTDCKADEPPGFSGDGGRESQQRGGGKRVPRHQSQLERLADKRQAELEREQAEKEERARAAQLRREHLEEKEKERKVSKAKFLAKTRRGQPVMRHRLDKILQTLQHEKQQGQ